jgi:hypothetical protein
MKIHTPGKSQKHKKGGTIGMVNTTLPLTDHRKWDTASTRDIDALRSIVDHQIEISMSLHVDQI